MLRERLTTYTPLGIRFWDPVLDIQVRDALDVKTWPASQRRQITQAFATGSGVYAFQNLPGLRAIEYPAGDTVDLFSVEPRRFVVEVIDTRNRFLPIRFGVWLPITGYRGPYRPGFPGSLPDLAESRFYLFSSPARIAPFGIAAIRAQVVEAGGGVGPFTPAAYALVEAKVEGELHYSYTDRRGCFVILFPYPPVDSAGGSPPGVLMAEQTWPVTIRLSYQLKTAEELDQLWEFSRIRSQPTASIFRTTTAFAAELIQDLEYGHELKLITDGPDTRSTLWVRPS